MYVCVNTKSPPYKPSSCELSKQRACVRRSNHARSFTCLLSTPTDTCFSPRLCRVPSRTALCRPRHLCCKPRTAGSKRESGRGVAGTAKRCPATAPEPAGQHEVPANEDLMEPEAQRRDRDESKEKQPRNLRDEQTAGDCLRWRRHRLALRRRTQMWTAPWRLRQPLSTQARAPASSLMRREELLPRQPWTVYSTGWVGSDPAGSQDPRPQHGH